MKIGILFGGNSLEHEISIVTAYSIKKKLKDIYEILMIYVDFDNNIYDASKVEFDDFKNNKVKKLKKTKFINYGIKRHKIDCMILAGHGENTEDGLFAGVCRFYNIAYVGSNVFAGSISMNKYLSYLYLEKNGINMIDTKLYTYNDYVKGVKNDIYPCIVKPVCGGSSLGIYVINNSEEFDDKIIKSFEVCNEVVIQKYYDNIIEYNLSLYEDGYSKLEKIDKKDEIFSFENKYNESFKLMHQNIEDDILYESFKEIGRKVYQLLSCSGIVRIDFFLIDEKIYVNEINVIPGGLSMYLYDDFNSVISDCIKNAIVKPVIKYQKSNYLSCSEINK